MSEIDTVPTGWPSPDSTDIQVMLLGTYHMDNPRLDELNLESDDVLTAQRQTELESFAADLARWNADRIAVERPYDRFEAVNSLYASTGLASVDTIQKNESSHNTCFETRPTPSVGAKSSSLAFESRTNWHTNRCIQSITRYGLETTRSNRFATRGSNRTRR